MIHRMELSINKSLYELSGVVYLSKIDLGKIPSNLYFIENVFQTAFYTRLGRYEFLVISCSLNNAPITFQVFLNDL